MFIAGGMAPLTLSLWFLVDYRGDDGRQGSIQNALDPFKQLAPCLVKAMSVPDAMLKLPHFGHIFCRLALYQFWISSTSVSNGSVAEVTDHLH